MRAFSYIDTTTRRSANVLINLENTLHCAVMNSFAAALKSFQEGSFSKAELEQMIDRDIGLGTVAAEDLLLLLRAHHSTSPLDEEDFDTIRRWISRAETRQRTQVGTQEPSQTTQPDLDDTVLNPEENREIGIGSVINNRFELIESIGSGGMSQVFKAIDRRKVEARSRDPYVAIKVMDVRGIAADQAFIAMQREVQKSQSLTHQHIVRVNDFDRDGDVVYTTMELLEGESLQQRIARSHTDEVPLDEAFQIVHEMGAALECAHDNNIIHADFKPSNVFLTTKRRVKVIDFGIARAVKRDDLTGGDQTLFDARALGAMTPAYASPEMIEDLEPHPRDDIYALGCVAYELITGVHPYSRLMATEARDRNHPLTRPKNLSKQQWAALEQTLQFDPFKRTSSVRTFLSNFNHEAGSAKKGLIYGGVAAAVAAIAAALVLLLPATDQDSDPIKLPEVVMTPTGTAGDNFTDCATCPTMTVVAAGSSPIGLVQTDLPGMFEYPEREVTVTDQFSISAHEVTVGQFREFADSSDIDWQGCRAADNPDANPTDLSWKSPGFAQSSAHPVTCVSWNDAQLYTEWLSEKTGEAYRLPSESEWEFTARTATTLPLQINTEDNVCNQANVADATAATVFGNVAAVQCTDGFAYTAPVTRMGAITAPTDLRGNLFEWTLDCWNPSYVGAPSDGSAWMNGNCDARVLRGGSWFSAPDAQRLTYRNRFPIDYRSNTFGFRIVRTI